ncbi:MAG: hypothetical protein IJB67_05225 [Firmicutes bacterium]|nr:hypothetical protein [Bacillota bacterium]
MTKRGKNAHKSDMKEPLYKFIQELYLSVLQETNTLAGKANLLFDFALAMIIVLYISTNSVVSVARIVASICNRALTEQTGDNIFELLLVFIIASVACIVFMHVTAKETSRKDKHMASFDDI